MSTKAAKTPQQVAHSRWFNPSNERRRNALVAQQYAACRAKVRGFLVRHGVAAADADDVCADVFVIALQRLPTFSGRSTMTSWIFGIAHKLASGYRASARVRYERPVGEVPEHGAAEGPDVALELEREAAAVRKAVASLKPGPCGVVTRFMLDEAPMDVVAKEQQVPLMTAYARLYAGQKVLKLALAAA